jgi:hypothetical protein
VNYATNQAPAVSLVRIEVEQPAGSDLQDPANLRALISVTEGLLWQLAAGLGDTVVTGVP